MIEPSLGREVAIVECLPSLANLFIPGKNLLAEVGFDLASHLSYLVLFEHTSKPQAVIMPYAKQYIPLECNPEVFNEFGHRIGLLPGMEFQDFYSIKDPKSLVPTGCTVHALILVFHCSGTYKDKVGPRKFKRLLNEGPGGADEVIWFKQTIQDASSFYAILHAICNDAHKRCSLVPNSILTDFLDECLLLPLADRAEFLENSKALETAYRAVAMEDTSKIPADAADEVAYRYVCFVKCLRDYHLYELDGELDGPVDHGVVGQGDGLLDKPILDFVQRYKKKRLDDDIGFSLFALVPTDACKNDGFYIRSDGQAVGAMTGKPVFAGFNA
ncbi:hypothetical protein N7G274_008915 [Stereocaulon virgatum]|uniref:Ubiquitin carboxyl-terminal hydrolase n=1 Tax=Stereocaulon virgatum TaxID=373712 RepID=A0ABR3ZZU8_9LECA